MKSPSLYTILTVSAVILFLDFIWLGFVAKPMYDRLRLAINPGFSLKGLPFNAWAAAGAYIFMIVSLSYLVVPNIKGDTIIDRLGKALWWGALWGIGVYGTYDMTNLATIHNFPVDIAVIDMLWGIIIGTIGALAGSYSI